MKEGYSLILILGLSLGSLASLKYDENVYNIFKQQIGLQVFTATSILNVTNGVLDGIKKNTSEEYLKKINTTITNAYDQAVRSLNKTVDPDCILEAKYSADDLISDSVDELNSCQQFTQAYDKMQTVEGTSGLETNLTDLQNSILEEAKKCNQKDFTSQLNCMMRKAGTSIEDLTKVITSNLHKVGGLSLLVQIEYGDCQRKEDDKLNDRVKDIQGIVLSCNSTTA